jgi:hypothetical protein
MYAYTNTATYITKYNGSTWTTPTVLLNTYQANLIPAISFSGIAPSSTYSDGSKTYFVNSVPPENITITVTNKVNPTITWQLSGTAAVSSTIKINGVLKQTYTTNLTSPLTYTLGAADLAIGSNTILIEATSATPNTFNTTLTATKTALAPFIADESTYSIAGSASIVGVGANESFTNATKVNTSLTPSSASTLIETQLTNSITTAAAKVTLKFNLTRSLTSVDKGITQIIGSID